MGGASSPMAASPTASPLTGSTSSWPASSSPRPSISPARPRTNTISTSPGPPTAGTSSSTSSNCLVEPQNQVVISNLVGFYLGGDRLDGSVGGCSAEALGRGGVGELTASRGGVGDLSFSIPKLAGEVAGHGEKGNSILESLGEGEGLAEKGLSISKSIRDTDGRGVLGKSISTGTNRSGLEAVSVSSANKVFDLLPQLPLAVASAVKALNVEDLGVDGLWSSDGGGSLVSPSQVKHDVAVLCGQASESKNFFSVPRGIQCLAIEGVEGYPLGSAAVPFPASSKQAPLSGEEVTLEDVVVRPLSLDEKAPRELELLRSRFSAEQHEELDGMGVSKIEVFDPSTMW